MISGLDIYIGSQGPTGLLYQIDECVCFKVTHNSEFLFNIGKNVTIIISFCIKVEQLDGLSISFENFICLIRQLLAKHQQYGKL